MVFSPYPDFLIIYSSHDLSLSQRLVLPSDYRKYYPTPLPQTALLRKPEGNFWTVKWTVSKDETISFADGWSKFVTDIGPVDGDFLFFTYDGSRSFWVRIFRNGLAVKPKAPIKIQEISDDETHGGDDDHEYDMGKEEDSHDQNMITSLSLGSSDEDYVDTSIAEVNKARERGESSQQRLAKTVDDPTMYIDDPTNPCFIPTSSSPRRPLVIPTRLIKDYVLKFCDTVNLMDRYGELEVKVGNWIDRIVVHKWGEIYERNNVTPEDVIVCEIVRQGGVVRSIKLHFVKRIDVLLS